MSVFPAIAVGVVATHSPGQTNKGCLFAQEIPWVGNYQGVCGNFWPVSGRR